MDQRAIIDVICKAGLNNLAGEIGALLGQNLTCNDIQLNITSKEDLFSNPERVKSAFTRMTISGDQKGNGYLLNRLSSAAILAGTLIMLPQDMIEENAKNGTLDGELIDAFGEVANIIAGVFTQAFVDKYPKTLRFVKQTVEELVPTKIDLSSEEPFPPGQYYTAGCRMTLADRDLGALELIVPAALFGLETEKLESSASPSAPDQTTKASVQPTDQPAETQGQQAPSAAPEVVPPAAPRPTFADAKKLIDVVFKSTIIQGSEEIGALLGHPLAHDDIQLVMTSKADFFSQHCLEKSVLTQLKVTGEKESLGFMLVQVPDAVVLGGTLIMLPKDQIEEQKNSGTFEGDVADAFGEIANILAGSLTEVFLDRYPRQLRFVKTDTDTVVPTKVDPAADQPFVEGNYYLVSFAIKMEGYELNRIQLIFPADLFDLDHVEPRASAPQQTSQGQQHQGATSPTAGLTPTDIPAPGEWGGAPLPQTEDKPGRAQITTPTTEPVSASAESGNTGAPSAPAASGPPVVLIISDQKQSSEPFSETLASAGYDCRTLSFQDEVKDFFQNNQILGIFLIMAQVGERGFAAAIKLQAAGQPLPPIIFAGSEWTKSAVLRAVKYGAKDILVLPASHDEIQDKVLRHIKKAS